MRKTAIFSVSIAVFFIAIDRLLKTYAKLADPEISLISDIFIFRYEENPYIAFSLPLSGPLLSLVIASIIFALIILARDRYKKESAELIPIIFIIFGAASNLYDRLLHGFVIDYLYLRYFTVFNLADSLIVLSTGYLLLLAFTGSPRKGSGYPDHPRSR